MISKVKDRCYEMNVNWNKNEEKKGRKLLFIHYKYSLQNE